jgi:predicted secreted protein
MASRGRLAAVYVSDDDGVTYVKVGGRLSASAPSTTDTIDTTNADSQGFKEFIEGDTSQTLEMSFHWEEGDAGQDMLVEANYTDPKPRLKYKWMFVEGTGKRQWEAKGLITNMGPSADDVTQCSVTVQIMEAPVMSAQP